RSHQRRKGTQGTRQQSSGTDYPPHTPSSGTGSSVASRSELSASERSKFAVQATNPTGAIVLPVSSSVSIPLPSVQSRVSTDSDGWLWISTLVMTGAPEVEYPESMKS